MADRLDRRQLNRALLARQFLLERTDWPLDAVIEHLVGLQAQNPPSPYITLWTRVAGFDAAALSQRFLDRQVVRIALMRSTIHLVTARDCLALRPVMDPVVRRATEGAWARATAEVDRDAVAATGRRLLEERPRTATELGKVLAEQWPAADPHALAQLVRGFVPLVQVPPRGLWRTSGPAAHAPAEWWLGRPLDRSLTLDAVVRRYLAAFGPATVRDFQAWSGLTGIRPVIESMRPGLRVFRTESGPALFDLEDAPRPEGDTPAPPRLLADFDNLLLSHADRTRVVADDHRRLVMSVNGIGSATFVVDGFVAGVWRVVGRGAASRLVLDPFVPIPRRHREPLMEEASRLLAFLTDGSASEVELAAGAGTVAG